jgi:hypothetical protein
MPPKGKGTWKKTATEAARPHKHMFGAAAHAFVCSLRADKKVAKHWCPDLVDKRGVSTISDRTCADDILLALVRKLDGKLTPVHKKKQPDSLSATQRGAAPFKLAKRPGRPSGKNAIADAAAELVERRGEQRVKSEAVKRQRGTSAPRCPRVRSNYEVGKFTTRGNPITAPKAVALVEVCAASRHPTPLTHCSLHLCSLCSP